MAPPLIGVFLTTIASQPALRQRQEYLLRILQVKKIPFTSYDLASDEDAKRLWRRKAPQGKQQLPGILIADEFPGTFQDFEEAVEFGELDTYLRRNEDYMPFAGDPAPLAEKVIGVPGVATPLQMTPERLKRHVLATPAPSPLKGKGIPVNKRQGDFDVSDELRGYGLQGVRVTEDELRDLVAELGLGGDEAGDLVKGLSSGGDAAEGSTTSAKKATIDEVPKGESDAKVVKDDSTKSDANVTTENEPAKKPVIEEEASEKPKPIEDPNNPLA